MINYENKTRKKSEGKNRVNEGANDKAKCVTMKIVPPAKSLLRSMLFLFLFFVVA